MWWRALLRATGVVLAGALLVGCASGGRGAPGATRPERGSGDRAEPAATPARGVADRRRTCTLRALRVLDRWDRARATAYARGDVARLRHLYAAGSPAGAADARVLEAYAERGLVVTRMRRQVLAARGRVCAEDRLVVAVTDRLVGARVVGRGGEWRLPAPRTHRWVLRFEAGARRWRLASVTSR